jgi:hypothetical protein
VVAETASSGARRLPCGAEPSSTTPARILRRAHTAESLSSSTLLPVSRAGGRAHAGGAGAHSGLAVALEEAAAAVSTELRAGFRCVRPMVRMG